MPRVPRGDSHSRHSSSHGSDHSGAHVRGTHHHTKSISNPKLGLTPNEGGGVAPSGPGDNDADDMMVGGMPPGAPGGMPPGGGMGGGSAPPM